MADTISNYTSPQYWSFGEQEKEWPTEAEMYKRYPYLLPNTMTVKDVNAFLRGSNNNSNNNFWASQWQNPYPTFNSSSDLFRVPINTVTPPYRDWAYGPDDPVQKPYIYNPIDNIVSKPTLMKELPANNVLAPYQGRDYVKEASDIINKVGPLTKDMIKGVPAPAKGLSAGAKGAIAAGIGLAGSIGGKLIAGGYDDGGVGNTIAGVGTAVGSIASLVPGVGTIAGAAIGAGANLLGGIYTRGFGVKRNEKNIAAVNNNIDNMKATGNLLASANTYDSVLSAANNMSGGLGFSNGAIAKNGWFNSKGDKIANDLRNSQNTALAMQGQGLATGVKNADLEQKNRTANSFIAAYGGDLTRDNGMGAIDYGFMSDLLANKRKQLEVKDRLPGMTGIPSTFNMFKGGGKRRLFLRQQRDAIDAARERLTQAQARINGEYMGPEVVVTGNKPKEDLSQYWDINKVTQTEPGIAGIANPMADYILNGPITEGMHNTLHDREKQLQQKDKAIQRANKNTPKTMYDATADLQDNLYKVGAFGDKVSYNKAVDGVNGRMTKAAIKKARSMGYIVDEQTGKVERAKALDDLYGDSERTGLLAILDHKKRLGVKDPYMVVDKQAHMVYLYKNGDELVGAFPSTGARNRGDGTMAEDATWYDKLPDTTPAGVFTGRWEETSPYLQNAPMFILKSDLKGGMPTAIHPPVNGRDRLAPFYNDKLSKDLSSGCVSILPQNLQKLYAEKLINNKDSVYILPENPQNKMVEEDGKIQMKYGENPTNYRGKDGVVRELRFNNTQAYGGFLDNGTLFELGGDLPDPKIIAPNSSTMVSRPLTRERIAPRTDYTYDERAWAGVFPSKGGGYHILDKDYNEVPISTEEANRRTLEKLDSYNKAGARNEWQRMFGPWYKEYALGGDVQTHGADFTNGMTHIDAGGSHEENPNEGVQVGVDPQGTPNLVEEGETIFNDYVYSKRIELDDEAKEKFHISKKREITYADMAKKLEKESEERPNDPISQGALKLQMEDLAQEQERQKAEMQAEEAREAFENMSPEEQVALMQQAEAQDQQAADEEAAMQEQAMAEQQMQGQPSEEEMMQQQMMAQQGGMPMQGMMPPQDTMMAAYGGPLNHYGLGGNLFGGGGKTQKKTAAQKIFSGWADALSNWVRTPWVMTGSEGANLVTGLGVKSGKKKFLELYNSGKSFDDAFAEAFPIKPYMLSSRADLAAKNRQKIRKELFDSVPKVKRKDGKYYAKELLYSSHGKTFKTEGEAVAYAWDHSSDNKKAQQRKSRAQQDAMIKEFDSRMQKEYGKNWFRDVLGGDKQGLSSLYQSYINGERSLDDIVGAVKPARSSSTQTALSTPGTPQNTFMQAAPTGGGGYSGNYSSYGYPGVGGGGSAAPMATSAAPAGVPSGYVPTIDANGQTVYVPATSQQATAQAQSTPPAFAAPEYNSDNVRNSILSALGINTASGFQDWMKKNNVTGIDNLDNLDWTTLRGNQSFMDAFNKGNSALAHAISQGYDFGQYTPDDLDKITFATINQGNWKNQGIAGWRGSKDPAWQELLEKGLVDESKDYTPKQIEELLRGTDAFKRGTEWLQKSDKNRLTYLKAILDDDLSPDEAKTYARRFINDDGTWKEGAKTDYNTIFNNSSGRAANPGTYWHTPTELIRGKDTVNWVQKDDGTWDRVLGDVGSGWEKLNTYNWHGQGENGKDLTYNYYKNPNAKAADAAKKEGEKNWQDNYDVLPIHRNEKLRYAGLFGPAVGLGLMAAGVGRPDTSGLDAAINAYSNRGSYLPSVRYTDGYYAYRPENPFIGDIAADNASAGTARAITNTTAPYGAQQASLLANAYNDQLARGTRIAQGRQYNNQERLQALNAYKNTDQFNAQAFNANEGVRAQILNQDRQTLANMRMSAAQQKMAADAGWYNSLYGNVSGLFKGISDLGRENAQHNMIADMAANGIFGTLTPNSPVATDFLKWQKKSGVTAEGGKINRKKNKRRGGLTY